MTDNMLRVVDAGDKAERLALARSIAKNREKVADAFEKLDEITRLEIAEKMGLVGKIRRFVPDPLDPTQAIPEPPAGNHPCG